MWSKYIVVIYVLLACYHCSKTTVPVSSTESRAIANYLSNGFEVDVNSDHSYAVALKKSALNGMSELLVLKLNNDSIVFKSSVLDPKVKWVDTFTIEVNRGLGIENDSNGREIFILNVAKNQKKIINQDYKKP